MRLTTPARPLSGRPCPPSCRRGVPTAAVHPSAGAAEWGTSSAPAAAAPPTCRAAPLSLSTTSAPAAAAPPPPTRRAALLSLSTSAAALLALAAATPTPAAAALEQAPAPMPFDLAAGPPYNLSIPEKWVAASGVSPGAAGGRATLAWFPPAGTDGGTTGTADGGVSVSLLATPIGADYTSLGSFGDAGGFAANLIASTDQSFRLRDRRVDPLSVQTASLLDAREVTASNGAKVYRVDYLLKRAGEAEARTFYTAVALGPDPNGRGFTNALYTVTAQATAGALASAPGLEQELVKAVESFQPPVAGKRSG